MCHYLFEFQSLIIAELLSSFKSNVILWLKLLLYRAHQDSSSSYTVQCYKWKRWVNVICQWMWWNMLKVRPQSRPQWGRIQIFFFEMKLYVVWTGRLSVCSRYFSLLFKPLHNNDINTDVCNNSSAHWQGWQKFRTRGNPLTWYASVQQLRTQAEWMNECVAVLSHIQGLLIVSWD